MSDRDAARAAKDQLRTRLAPVLGVGGIGIGRRPDGYVVTVDVADEAHTTQVPSSWDGVDVEVRVVGRITPLAAPGAEDAAGLPGLPDVGGPTGGPDAQAGRPGTDRRTSERRSPGRTSARQADRRPTTAERRTAASDRRAADRRPAGRRPDERTADRATDRAGEQAPPDARATSGRAASTGSAWSLVGQDDPGTSR